MPDIPTCYSVGDLVPVTFDSYDGNRASVTITGLAKSDIKVYRLSDDTLLTSENGFTLLDTDGIDYQSHVGIHGFTINTGDNSHAGFWLDGYSYLIIVDAITIDGQTVRFSCLLALGYLLRPTTAGRTLDVNATGEAGVDVILLDSSAIMQNDGYIRARNEYDSQLPGAGDEMDLIDGAITAAKIADAAIDNATFAADVGSTAYATNIIALAVRKALDDLGVSTHNAAAVETLVLATPGQPIATDSNGNTLSVADDGSNLKRRKDSDR